MFLRFLSVLFFPGISGIGVVLGCVVAVVGGVAVAVAVAVVVAFRSCCLFVV